MRIMSPPNLVFFRDILQKSKKRLTNFALTGSGLSVVVVGKVTPGVGDGVVTDGASVVVVAAASRHSFSSISSWTLSTASTIVAIINADPTNPSARTNLFTTRKKNYYTILFIKFILHYSIYANNITHFGHPLVRFLLWSQEDWKQYMCRP